MRLMSALIALSLAVPALAQDATDEESSDSTLMARPDADEAPVMGTDEPIPSTEASDSDIDPGMEDAEQDIGLATDDAVDDDDDAARDERMAEIERTLLKQREDLTRMRLKLLETPDLTFDLEGEYRSRGYLYPNLYAGQERDARYMDHWLRLRPSFHYKDLASLHFEVRGLQNSLWGDNNQNAQTPLFTDEPSNTTIDGQENPSLVLNRAWLEVNVPVGVIRVGRQPSAWGLGILVQGGDGFDDTWGENRTASTFDRALFATKPVAIAQTIMGKDVSDIPLFFAMSVDRLVESSVNDYYGYQCTSGIPDTSDSYDLRCDSNADGITDRNHDYIDTSPTTMDRERDWWVDQDDDVWELVLALIYKAEDINYLGGRGDLAVGGYAIHRLQRETQSDVWIWDAYLEADVHNAYVAFEGVTITGESSALTLPDFTDPENPLAKDVSIGSYVARAGYTIGDGDIMVETGFASGDENPTDNVFTGRPGNSDYNVGLLIYEEILAQATAARWGQGAKGLWSNGGVYNSRYVHPVLHYSPLNNWDLYGGAVLVWPHKPDGSIIQCREGEDCVQANATSRMIGWELDGALKHRWHEHVLFSLEAAYAHVTDRVPLEAVGLNPEGNFFTAQARIAWQF